MILVSGILVDLYWFGAPVCDMTKLARVVVLRETSGGANVDGKRNTEGRANAHSHAECQARGL